MAGSRAYASAPPARPPVARDPGGFPERPRVRIIGGVTAEAIPIVLARVVPFDALDPAQPAEAAVLALCEEATTLVAAAPWCGSVVERHLGFGVGDVIAVVLFRVARDDGGSPWQWAVVGDVPPALMWSEAMLTPARALEGYVAAMRDEVTTIRGAGPLDGLVRFDAPEEVRWADALERRLDYIESALLPDCRAGAHVAG